MQTNKTKFWTLAALIIVIGFAFFYIGVHAQSDKTPLTNPTNKRAILLNIDGAIGPAISDFIVRGINHAIKTQAAAVIIQIDTPGGLDKSMREMIKSILASPIPVLTYVAPSGARAASAGTFLLYASHIAAMAPGTNLGAASPVSIGGGFPSPTGTAPKDKNSQNNKKQAPTQKDTMEKKVTNDALAYIRSLANIHSRNAKWAEKAVGDAATLTAHEAKNKNVIDFVANDISDLLTKVHGRKVLIKNHATMINTKNLQVELRLPDWRMKFLAVITDPSVAYILLLLGVYGLFFEFAHPGFIVPGVTGAISLLLALYAFQMLPINYAGLALIFLGMIFMVSEAFIPSFGALGIGGIIAFAAGSILLLETQTGLFTIQSPIIITMVIINAVFFFFIIGMAIKARQRPVVSGPNHLLHAEGIMLEDNENTAQAQVHGEIWKVKSEQPLKSGDTIIVTGIKGLTLTVKPKG